MPVLNMTAKRLTTLLKATESNIDMYGDMALDPMYLTPDDIRALAEKSNEEIRATISANAKEADANLLMLEELQSVYSELKAMQSFF